MEAPTVMVNTGFSFRVIYPVFTLLLYVFTNMNIPMKWADPQDDISFNEVVLLAVRLAPAA